jgi:transposase
VLWSGDNDLQSLQSLGEAWTVAAPIPGPDSGRPQRCSDDRQHHGQSASLGGWWKRGAEAQAIGRSRGGRTTKIHAVVDGCGRPIAFEITPGQVGDVRVAPALLASLPPARLCAGDTAYDSNGLRQFLIERGTQPVIPNNPTRKRFHPFDAEAYKQRNLVERMFCRLKDWRRIATRYDKLATNFAAAVALAAIITWWI